MSLRGRRPGNWLGLVFVAGALAWLPWVGLPAAAQAKWGRPFEFAAPGSLDVLAPQLAFSPSGAAAAAFGVQDVDTPGSSQAYLTVRTARGGVGRPRSIAGARQILALAYDGGTLSLLTGSSPSDQACCSSAQALVIGRRPRTLVAGLAGATRAQLLTLGGGRMLAAVATGRGVWVAQSRHGDGFAPPRRLTGAAQMPQSLAAAALAGGHSIVAWTAAAGAAGANDPRQVYVSGGSRTAAPRRARTAVTVPAGHRIDELGVAPRAAGATLAWIESWYDRRGGYHSQVKATDLGAHATIRTLSSGNRLASGLAFAGGAGQDQGVAWQSCRGDTSCTTQVATRAASGQFGAVRTLGGVDPAQAPAVAIGPRGQVLVGWVAGGRPLAAVAPSPGGGFGAPTILSTSTYALDLTVAFGPRRTALAAWSQGTLNPSVVGAAYTG